MAAREINLNDTANVTVRTIDVSVMVVGTEGPSIVATLQPGTSLLTNRYRKLTLGDTMFVDLGGYRFKFSGWYEPLCASTQLPTHVLRERANDCEPCHVAQLEWESGRGGLKH